MSVRASDASANAPAADLLVEPLDARAAVAALERSRAALGLLALAVLALCSLAIVFVAAGQPTILVPQSTVRFPGWLAGPLHPLARGFPVRATPTAVFFSVALGAMTAAYAAAVLCAPRLRPRAVAFAIGALHLIWLLAPTMPLTDVFNYLGYARLGGLHGVNPYLHGIAAARHDPVFALTTWHHLASPYGPLYTLATYALAPLPLPVAYWTLKLATVAASLGCVALLWRCAQLLGRPPLRPVLLYAANPLVLVYGLGGFHNDFFLLLATLGAIVLVLERRDARAGALLTAAVAVKLSAGILLPFLLVGARGRRRFLAGAAAAAPPIALASLLAFGFALPNLGDQSSLLSSFSVPNALGQLVGLGGAPPWLLAFADALAAGALALLAWQVWRGRMGWLAGAGWATLALILSLAWLQPWYAMWLLPLAALAASRQLARSTMLLCLYLLLTFLPLTGMALAALRYEPMDSAVGRASIARMHALQGLPTGRPRHRRGHRGAERRRSHHRRSSSAPQTTNGNGRVSASIQGASAAVPSTSWQTGT